MRLSFSIAPFSDGWCHVMEPTSGLRIQRSGLIDSVHVALSRWETGQNFDRFIEGSHGQYAELP